MAFLIFMLVLFASYFIFYFFLSVKETYRIPNLNEEKISKLLRKEKIKLGINYYDIKWKFTNKNNSYTDLINGVYFIYFGRKPNVLTVKHEVFHVFREKKKHYSKFFFYSLFVKILYLLYFEFRAKLYAVYDIKL